MGMPRDLREKREVAISNRADLETALLETFQYDYIPTSLDRIELNADGTMEAEGQVLPYTESVHEDIVRMFKIPLSFERGIDFATLKMLMDALAKDRARGLTACVDKSSGAVVGIAPPGYADKVVTSSEFLQTLDANDDRWEFSSAIVSDRSVQVNLLVKGAEVEPAVGDIVQVGLALTNSETGGRALQSELFSLRLVCTNGMTARDDRATVRFKKFSNQSHASGLRCFRRHLDRSMESVSAIAERLYSGVADQVVMDNEVIALHRAVQRRVRGIDAAEALGIDPEAKSEIDARIRRRDPGAPPQVTDYRTWDVHNAVTAFAKTVPLIQRQALEALGGNILMSALQRRQESNTPRFSVN